MRRLFLAPLLLILLASLAWSVLTTPVFANRSIRVDFDWSKQSGFSNVRTVGGLARVLDPPYDRYFTNPLVAAQAKRLILSRIKEAESAHRGGFERVSGRLDIWVCCLGYVRGFDYMSETSHVELK